MLELRYVPLSELRQHFLIGNAKRHDLGQLWDSFQRYGFRDPLAYDAKLNAGAGGIVEGNGRLETLASAYDDGQKAPQGIKVDEAGEWFVPVIHGLDGRTEAEALAYSIDHNSTVLSGAEFTALDISKLYDHEGYLDCLRELAEGSSLPLTVDGDDLELLLETLDSDYDPPSEEEDEAATADLIGEAEEGKILPRFKLGDIIALGRHRIACGDSTDEGNVRKLLGGERLDMIFTDPPYGVDYEGGHFHSGDVKIKRKREKLASDNEDIYSSCIPVMASFCDGPIYTWFAGSKALPIYQAVSLVGEIHALIIWHKTNATYAAMNAQYKQRHEPCLYWKAKGKTLKWVGPTTENTLWEIKRDGQNTFHPTQKPTELAERAMGNHDATLIGDFFLGSGSTVIAAEKMHGNRTVYGFELSPDYIEVICRRWEQFTGGVAELVGSL